MNTAVRVAVRVGMDRGHTLLAVRDGFRGLAEGRVEEMTWMSVSGWVSRPGADLGTDRFVPTPDDIARIATQLEAHARRWCPADRRLGRLRRRPCAEHPRR